MAHPLGRFQPCGGDQFGCCDSTSVACGYCAEGDGPDEYLLQLVSPLSGLYVLTREQTCLWAIDLAGEQIPGAPGACNLRRLTWSIAAWQLLGSWVAQFQLAAYDEQSTPAVVWRPAGQQPGPSVACMVPTGEILMSVWYQRDWEACARGLRVFQTIDVEPVP